MNCAKHPESAAIGICCNCGRAMCVVCNQPRTTPKLVCSAECEKNVAQNDAALEAILAKTNRGAKATGIYTLALGVGGFVLALYHMFFDPHAVLIGIGITVGVIFCITGVVMIRVGKMR